MSVFNSTLSLTVQLQSVGGHGPMNVIIIHLVFDLLSGLNREARKPAIMDIMIGW